LLTFLEQKEREVLFKSINLGYKVWGQYFSIYAKDSTKKRKSIDLNSDQKRIQNLTQKC